MNDPRLGYALLTTLVLTGTGCNEGLSAGSSAPPDLPGRAA